MSFDRDCPNFAVAAANAFAYLGLHRSAVLVTEGDAIVWANRAAGSLAKEEPKTLCGRPLSGLLEMAEPVSQVGRSVITVVVRTVRGGVGPAVLRGTRRVHSPVPGRRSLGAAVHGALAG